MKKENEERENQNEKLGKLFRNAWIKGIFAHYRGTKVTEYTRSWGDIPQWEQQACIATFHDVAAFLRASSSQQAQGSLTREQGGRIVCAFWNMQMLQLFEKSRPSFITSWENLPVWQQNVDSDIFVEIQEKVLKEGEKEGKNGLQ
jgi:hypothetical protein